MYIDDIKLFAQNEKELETLIQIVRKYRYRNGIWHRKMRNANNEKRQTTPGGSSRTTKSSNNQNARKPSNDREYWKLTPSNKWKRKEKKKKKKRVSQKNQKDNQDKTQ